MTKGEKYLKDGVNMVDFIRDFREYSIKDNLTGYSILATFLSSEAKPTLTEDEKVILRIANNGGLTTIKRDKYKMIWLQDDEENIYTIPRFRVFIPICKTTEKNILLKNC